MHMYYDPGNGWSEQNGTIDEAIADLRREGGDNFTIEEDTRHAHFRVVSIWMVGPDGKGDECFFIEDGHTWTCGCGTTNGVNLSVCRVCGRQEGARQ